MNDILAEPLDRLLADRLTPEALRGVLNGSGLEGLRMQIAELGYEDALITEDAGGLGLQLSDLTPMLIALGRRLCPVPLGQTIVARAILSQGGVNAPSGDILLLTPIQQQERIVAQAVPLALSAKHALLDVGEQLALVDIASAEVRPSAKGFSLAADLEWSRLPVDAVTLRSPGPLAPTAAALGAAVIAGSIAGALELTAGYAGTRRQFGKAIADFQAIQQQLAVLAEEAAASAMAATIGCDGAGPLADPFAAAVAKMRASRAAASASSIAHGVHGAIGFSEEYDLQLFTRRMAEERIANGGEVYWAEQIGAMRLADGLEASTVAFVRQRGGRIAA